MKSEGSVAVRGREITHLLWRSHEHFSHHQTDPKSLPAEHHPVAALDSSGLPRKLAFIYIVFLQRIQSKGSKRIITKLVLTPLRLNPKEDPYESTENF